MGSIWEDSTEMISAGQLEGSHKTDVLVIGAGMAGILTAYFLTRRGVDCTVIDAGNIAGGATKNTTAKITCQHSLIYSRIIKSSGAEKAAEYAKVSQSAITAYRDMVHSLEIDCDFEDASACLYAVNDEKLIENEYRASKTAGIDANLTATAELPFPIKATLEYRNQAQFNPLKFINHLAYGLKMYSCTRVLEVYGEKVTTDHGVINAKKIVIATHYPFINKPGYYFMRMHQERSYVIALDNAGRLDNTYFGVDGGKYSFRSYGDKVIMGGSNHRTGENASGRKYERLTNASQKFYPESQVYCRWSAQDCITGDGMPYIGRFSSKIRNMYVATGFNKWGMTGAMASGMILSDMILGKKPEYSIFSPARLNHGVTVKSLAVDGTKTLTGLGKSMFQVPDKKPKDIGLEKGAIVQYGHSKAGMYKDNDGEHVVSAICPHMHCQLTWNADETTWDCPCHGSRFDTSGHVISGPAQAGIYKKTID